MDKVIDMPIVVNPVIQKRQDASNAVNECRRADFGKVRQDILMWTRTSSHRPEQVKGWKFDRSRTSQIQRSKCLSHEITDATSLTSPDERGRRMTHGVSASTTMSVLGARSCHGQNTTRQGTRVAEQSSGQRSCSTGAPVGALEAQCFNLRRTGHDDFYHGNAEEPRRNTHVTRTKNSTLLCCTRVRRWRPVLLVFSMVAGSDLLWR